MLQRLVPNVAKEPLQPDIQNHINHRRIRRRKDQRNGITSATISTRDRVKEVLGWTWVDFFFFFVILHRYSSLKQQDLKKNLSSDQPHSAGPTVIYQPQYPACLSPTCP